MEIGANRPENLVDLNRVLDGCATRFRILDALLIAIFNLAGGGGRKVLLGSVKELFLNDLRGINRW